MLLLLPVPVPDELAEDFVAAIVIPIAIPAAEMISITMIKVKTAARPLQNAFVSAIGTLNKTISWKINKSI